MKNPGEASLIILLLFLVLEIVSDSSIACLQHGDKSCYEHKLRCNGKVIWIIDAMFGYRSGCGAKMPPKYKNCSSPCCNYLETDCFVGLSDAELLEVKSDCSQREQCKVTKFIFHVPHNSLECQDKDVYVNTYSKIDYECVRRNEYHTLSSTAIRSWATSTRAHSSSIHINISSLVGIVPSFSVNDSSHTIEPMEVDVTTAKSLTDQQSSNQPSDTGAVIGGIVGGLIFTVVLVVISVYFIKRHRMNPKEASQRLTPIQNTGQQIGGNSNSQLEYENGDPIDPINDVYSCLEADRLPTIYSRLDLKTTVSGDV